MAEFYCDYVHRRLPNYRMVMPKDVPIAAGGNIDDWDLLRVRAANQLNPTGRGYVDTAGYTIIRVHVPLEEIRKL
ncbi:hypothetical protein [Bosea sp. (in: a-proteobacteria)]|uniref:hypothetical protein n=1 Tax=Bosea sp. (in: a-proteobacteria) TaxID=1871050 RepID=UPI002605DA0D|nr:hypothetical protein [Bosea sp. (in: a-proteobacteria)]MCO5089774.1 hypothetical protein [Bosea sp. (in: a-proteobacteria)]